MSAYPITAERVLAIVRDPSVWRTIACDEMATTAYVDGAWEYLGDGAGMMAFRRIAKQTSECHIAVCRGHVDAQAFALDCLAEIRRRGVTRFVAPIGDWNRAALRLARRCGFSEFMRLDGVCHRAGVPHQVILLESK